MHFPSCGMTDDDPHPDNGPAVTEFHEEEARLGAYGFRLRGVDGARDALVRAPIDWPDMQVSWELSADAPASPLVSPEAIVMPLNTGGVLRLRRKPLGARFSLPWPLTPVAAVHPYLAPAAALASYWLGRESFHAGAVLGGGGAWALLGAKGDGKSTILAALSALGGPVLADDVVVLDRGQVLAGPRTLDLRGESARRLGVGTFIGRLGQRERWRMALGPTPAAAPLCGWIVLEWGDAMHLHERRGADRLTSLLPHRMLNLPPADPSGLVEFSARPVLELCRPRSWEALEPAARLVADAIGAPPPATPTASR